MARTHERRKDAHQGNIVSYTRAATRCRTPQGHRGIRVPEGGVGRPLQGLSLGNPLLLLGVALLLVGALRRGHLQAAADHAQRREQWSPGGAAAPDGAPRSPPPTRRALRRLGGRDVLL